mmetsp:Transcript_96096/g.267004  ORF Transcript_96096/g.267004 Transcript_96096/m.267004 type:complete len:143 (-) Transcript_96096:75-503(-)
MAGMSTPTTGLMAHSAATSRHSDFDFFLGDYRLAVARVIDKHHLALSSRIEQGAPTLPRAERVPLQSRPLVFSVDPAEASMGEQAWLLAAVFLLCLCPCAGPLPLAVVLLYLCWARDDRYAGRHAVAPEDDDEGVFSATPYA